MKSPAMQNPSISRSTAQNARLGRIACASAAAENTEAKAAKARMWPTAAITTCAFSDATVSPA
jgi:hypothetical protein